jgi:fructose-bisphosphate aldolase/6-deoxy-5-ketofructose 1-phosphate synthase
LALNSIKDVVDFKKSSNLEIIGVGYTVYIGSEYESQMLSEAAQIVYQAHMNDLLAILWVYPRGKSVKNERDADIIAGAAGVAACLGADFVKINPPEGDVGLLKQAVMAAGRTKVICSGGEKKSEDVFLQELKDQITIGVFGCAIGRNIHQREEKEAIEFCKKIKKVLSDSSK